MNRQNITELNNEFFSYLYKLDKRWKEYDEKDVSRAATNVRTTVRARADNVFPCRDHRLCYWNVEKRFPPVLLLLILLTFVSHQETMTNPL